MCQSFLSVGCMALLVIIYLFPTCPLLLLAKLRLYIHTLYSAPSVSVHLPLSRRTLACHRVGCRAGQIQAGAAEGSHLGVRGCGSGAGKRSLTEATDVIGTSKKSEGRQPKA